MLNPLRPNFLIPLARKGGQGLKADRLATIPAGLPHASLCLFWPGRF